MKDRIQALLKKLFPWSSLAYASVFVGLFSVFVLYVTSFTFFLYLYQPIFSPIETVFFLTPSVDYDLLSQAVRDSEIHQQRIAEELENIYPDPFSHERSLEEL